MLHSGFHREAVRNAATLLEVLVATKISPRSAYLKYGDPAYRQESLGTVSRGCAPLTSSVGQVHRWECACELVFS
jgi:hypothetical protein